MAMRRRERNAAGFLLADRAETTEDLRQAFAPQPRSFGARGTGIATRTVHNVDESNIKELLQISGWLITVVGHIQLTFKRRAGWITWIVANIVMIALCARVEFWWSIGMYLTNTLGCVWSYRRWSGDEGSMRPLFVKRMSR